MKSPTFRFLVDTTMLLLFLGVLATTAVVQFIFPAGTRAAGWILWGLGYDAWSLLQGVSIAAFTLNVLVHLILQWNWVCNFITSRISRRRGDERHTPLPDGIKTIYGVSVLIAVLTLLGLLLIAAEFTIRAPAA